jgi:hypothetical protein
MIQTVFELVKITKAGGQLMLHLLEGITTGSGGESIALFG